MMHLLLAAGKSPWLGFFGKLHPGMVHFPIALLSVAAFFETLQILKKRREPAGGTLPMTVLAALGATAASLFGWLLSEYESTEGGLVDLHKWLGFGTSAVAIVAALFAWKALTSAGALTGLRISLILGSILVLATGYVGGELVYGDNHIFSVFVAKKPLLRPVEPASEAKIDFVTQIAPIIKESCFKCHGGEKTQGKLKLTTKAEAMKGGENGKCINPGKPSISSFYTLLLSKDPDERMPAKSKKPLPPEQIEAVKKWIEQGADWPADFVFGK